MDWATAWTAARQALVQASKDLDAARAMPIEQRILSPTVYRQQVKTAQIRLKLADQRCAALRRMRRRVSRDTSAQIVL